MGLEGGVRRREREGRQNFLWLQPENRRASSLGAGNIQRSLAALCCIFGEEVSESLIVEQPHGLSDCFLFLRPKIGSQ